jgi:hypothetical protein
MNLSIQLTESIEKAQTLKPLFNIGLFEKILGRLLGNNTQNADEIYFSASERGVANLFLLRDFRPDMGISTKVYLFSAEGEPKNVEAAIKVANSLSKEEIDAMTFGVSSSLFYPVNDPSAKNKQGLDASIATKALFNLSWPEAVFALTNLFFEEKDNAKNVYNYVLWARKEGILYLNPIIEAKEKKLLK